MSRAIVRLLPVAAAMTLATDPAFSDDSAKERALLRKLVSEYAACVVKSHYTEASEAIIAISNNDEITGRYARLIDSNCLARVSKTEVDLRFPDDTLRNALADALVNTDFATHGEVSFANRLPLAQPPEIAPEKVAEVLAKTKSEQKRKELQEKYRNQNTLSWVSRFGECVVRQDPEGSRYWLLTPPETPEETSRIAALQPAFGACLGSGKVKFTRFIMRGTVAINYYRLAKATIVPTAGSVR